MRLRRARRRSTASALATSPARWPPIPSATAKTFALGEEVVLVVGPDATRVGGRAPAQVGHSLRLQHRVADLDAVARVEQVGAVQRLPLWNVPFVEPRSSTIAWPSTS